MRFFRQAVNSKKIIRQSIILSIILVIALVSIIYWIYAEQVQFKKTSIIEKEQSGIDVVERVLNRDLSAVIQDLIQLSEDEIIMNTLTGSNELQKEAIATRLYNMVDLRRIYREARLIDFTGNELLRIESRNGITVQTPYAQLQNKSDRYYFQETMNLKKGDVYISPLDLNVEQGELEEPYTSVIRLTTPVFNFENRLIGMVILNYKGQTILDEVAHANTTKPGTLLLLNSNGFFLRGFSPNDEWGFQIEERKDSSFPTLFPESWNRISGNEAGQFINESGLFLFNSVNLKKEVASILENMDFPGKYNIKIEDDYDLILVSYLSNKQLQSQIAERLGTFPLYLFLIGFAISLISILGSIVLGIYRINLQKSLMKTKEMARFPEFNPGPVIQIDIEGKVSLSNHIFKEILGFDPLGFTWANISERFSVSKPREGVISSNGTEIIHQEEWLIGERNFLFTYKKDKDCEKTYIYGTDITGLDKITRVMEQSEQKFRGIFNQSFQSVLLLDSNGLVLQANETCLKAANITEKSLFQNFLWDTPLWNYSEMISDQIKEAIETSIKGEFIRLNLEYPSSNKETQYLDFSLKPINDEKGIVQFLIAEWRDITDYIKVDSEVKKLALVAEKTSNGVVITNTKGQVEWVNSGFESITGYSLEEMLGKIPGSVLQGKETNKETVKRIDKALSRQQAIKEEIINYCKDGHPYWLELYIEPIFDDNNNLQKYIAIESDVTKRKKIEEELVKAKKDAELASIAKSDFLANMSHEIRTPMNAIIGMTHLALQTDLTQRQEDYLEKIEISSKSLLGIINDILDFSKIEAGKLKIEKVPIDLTEILKDAVILNAENAAQKGLELVVDMDMDIPPELIGDPTRINQILVNLINNAVKFTDKGKIETRVSIKERRHKSLELIFSVSDTGIGMNEKQIENLFQKFSQADTSTTRKYGGTGLGLSICRQLVELMGGEIQIKSTPGVGSTFTFILTLEIQEKSKSDIMPVLPLNLRELKVLLIERNQKTAKILKEQLTNLSFKVSICSEEKSFEAKIELARAEKEPFELIIADFSFFTSDSIPLKELNRTDIPMIIITSISELLKAEKMIEEKEMALVLQKPFTSSHLFNSIMNVFGHLETVDKRRRHSINPKEKIPDLRAFSILLVEDNKINQQVASELLRVTNVSLTIANNGKEAIDLVNSGTFDLILMDIQMPVMDGLEATSEIRKLDPPTGNIPIIAMTARAMAGDKKEFLDMGIEDYISKPIDPETFYSTLAQWLIEESEMKHSEKEPIRLNQDDKAGFPEKIPGIDLKSGLNRVSGNKALYINLLNDFIKENKDFDKQVLDAYQSGDLRKAERLAHTLKGVSGNLGIDTLHQKANLLEKAISNRSENVQDLLISANDTIKSVNSEIEKALPLQQEKISLESKKKDIESILPQITVLEQLLNESDMEALDIFYNIKNSLMGLEPELVQTLERKLESLDFAMALELLTRLKRKER